MVLSGLYYLLETYNNIKNGNLNFSNGKLADIYEIIFVSLLLNLKITIYRTEYKSNKMSTISIYSGSDMSQFVTRADNSIVNNIMREGITIRKVITKK